MKNLTQLKYKNQEIPGYFISEDGKIYDENGVEQELKLYKGQSYYRFKSHAVHKMMCHSFFGYKEGFDVHHKNENKLDNRLDNLKYLTHADHCRLHSTGNKYTLGKKLSVEHKEKISSANKGKKRSTEAKKKMSKSRQKKVYCLQLNKVFESIKQAAQELSLARSGISMCCLGIRKTCGKFQFKYHFN